MAVATPKRQGAAGRKRLGWRRAAKKRDLAILVGSHIKYALYTTPLLGSPAAIRQ